MKVYEKRFKMGAHSLDASTSFYQFFTPSPNNAEKPEQFHSAESVPDGRPPEEVGKLTPRAVILIASRSFTCSRRSMGRPSPLIATWR